MTFRSKKGDINLELDVDEVINIKDCFDINGGV